MTTSRRTFLAGGAAGALALTAGCVDFVTGSGPLELEAERAAPTDAALEETEYAEYELTQETIEESVDVGVERDVSATVWLSSYAKEIEYRGRVHDGCFFAAVSIPDVSVAGYSVNPVEEMSNEELLEEFRGELDGEYGDLDDLSHEDEFGLEILDEGRTVDVFEGETELEGAPVEVELLVSSFTHEDDILVLFGSYPAPFAGESANVEELLESVEHPV
ncbi:DUF6517 family protein [Natronolimnohabitans innermongolicus]|uniref:Lipoprotein n=1 Tax=Natronolimnohabitans innermongolicus JCM 12255 TaxID=1227499 RepID=L9X7J7_9EURY|nr:DUF6517 family protein [Natronolimnohabitans innermongolicus]ELY57700.1 hypothetical protein C493_07409 [Natronolimnohabitans innermongolicus JCM 12255]